MAACQYFIAKLIMFRLDGKNAGVVRFQEQIDAIAKRISDLEGRINGFNEEVKRLNEEEKKLISSATP